MNDTDSSDTEFHAGNFLALSTRCSDLRASYKRYDPDILRAHTYFDTSLSTSAPTFPNNRPICCSSRFIECCGLSWIELSKGGAYDVRFDVFLREMRGNNC